MADTFEIISQRQTHEITTTGALRDVMHIDFVTRPSGFAGFVRVPLTDYPAAVAPLIAARAATMEAVGGQ